MSTELQAVLELVEKLPLYRPSIKRHPHSATGFMGWMTTEPTPADDDSNESLAWVRLSDVRDLLRSDEFKRLREDAERLDWVLSRVIVDAHGVAIPCGHGNAAKFKSASLHFIDAAIDAARTPEIAR